MLALLPCCSPTAGGDTRPAAGGAAMSGGGSSGKGTLNSFPVPSVVEDEERDAVDEEIHRDEDVSIKASANGATGPVVGTRAMGTRAVAFRGHMLHLALAHPVASSVVLSLRRSRSLQGSCAT